MCIVNRKTNKCCCFLTLTQAKIAIAAICFAAGIYLAVQKDWSYEGHLGKATGEM